MDEHVDDGEGAVGVEDHDATYQESQVVATIRFLPALTGRPLLQSGASFGLARFIARLLFQTSTADPPTFSLVPILLMLVALIACYLPARRATRVDSLVALRTE